MNTTYSKLPSEKGNPSFLKMARAMTPSPWIPIVLTWLMYGSIAWYLNHIRVPELIKVAIDNATITLGRVEPMVSSRGVETILPEESIVPVADLVHDDENGLHLDIPDFDDETFLENYICDPEHKYQVEITRRDPMLLQIRHFLSDEEAEHLKVLGHPMMDRSTVMNDEEAELHDVDQSRTSYSAFLNAAHDKVVQCIEERAAKFAQVDVNQTEPVQVVRYRKGQQYLPHYDYFSRDVEKNLVPGGQRLLTFFVYLNTVDPRYGGTTAFPELGLEVPAVKGTATFWYNMDSQGNDDPRTLHGGSEVKGDVFKYGLNMWVHEHAYRSVHD